MRKIFFLPILLVFVVFCPTIFAIPNPASVYCEKNGGKLEIINSNSGSTGMCTLTNGVKCEEWSYFRGECGSSVVSNYLSCVKNEGIIIGNENKKQCEYEKKVYVENGDTVEIADCLAYYDGCNSCTVKDGKVGGCTLMSCGKEEITEPVCTLRFTKGIISSINSTNLSLGGDIDSDVIEEYQIHEKATIDNDLKKGQYVRVEYVIGDGNKIATDITKEEQPEQIFCGGAAGIKCDTGYKCIIIGNLPNNGGTCIKEDVGTKICTMDYNPVCATMNVKCEKGCNPVYKTFSNKCQLESNPNAKIAYNGACNENLPIHTSYNITSKQKNYIANFIQKWSQKKSEKVVFNKMIAIEKIVSQFQLLSRLHNKNEVIIEYLAANLREIVLNNFENKVNENMKDLGNFTDLTDNKNEKFTLLSKEWINEPHFEENSIIGTLRIVYTNSTNNFENNFIIKYNGDKLDIKLNK